MKGLRLATGETISAGVFAEGITTTMTTSVAAKRRARATCDSRPDLANNRFKEALCLRRGDYLLNATPAFYFRSVRAIELDEWRVRRSPNHRRNRAREVAEERGRGRERGGVNRRNGERLGSRFHSANTRLRKPTNPLQPRGSLQSVSEIGEMTASMGMEAAIRRKLTRRRWRTFHPLLNSLVQGKGGRRDTPPVKRASSRLPRFFFSFLPLFFPLLLLLLLRSPPIAYTSIQPSRSITARKRPCPRRCPIDFDRPSR